MRQCCRESNEPMWIFSTKDIQLMFGEKDKEPKVSSDILLTKNDRTEDLKRVLLSWDTPLLKRHNRLVFVRRGSIPRKKTARHSWSAVMDMRPSNLDRSHKKHLHAWIVFTVISSYDNRFLSSKVVILEKRRSSGKPHGRIRKLNWGFLHRSEYSSDWTVYPSRLGTVLCGANVYLLSLNVMDKEQKLGLHRPVKIFLMEKLCDDFIWTFYLAMLAYLLLILSLLFQHGIILWAKWMYTFTLLWVVRLMMMNLYRLLFAMNRKNSSSGSDRKPITLGKRLTTLTLWFTRHIPSLSQREPY